MEAAASQIHRWPTLERPARGLTPWVWDVEITDDVGNVCAIGRVTLAVRPGLCLSVLGSAQNAGQRATVPPIAGPRVT